MKDLRRPHFKDPMSNVRSTRKVERIFRGSGSIRLSQLTGLPSSSSNTRPGIKPDHIGDANGRTHWFPSLTSTHTRTRQYPQQGSVPRVQPQGFKEPTWVTCRQRRKWWESWQGRQGCLLHKSDAVDEAEPANDSGRTVE